MKKRKIKNLSLFTYLLISLLLFLVDRILKYIALNKIVATDVSDGFFVLEKNSGIAFSLPLPQIILPTLTIIIILFVISYSIKYHKSQQPILSLATILIITGALSNLLDRLRFNYVIDYINLKFWPVFNIADVMIVVGVILWVWKLGYKKSPN